MHVLAARHELCKEKKKIGPGSIYIEEFSVPTIWMLGSDERI